MQEEKKSERVNDNERKEMQKEKWEKRRMIENERNAERKKEKEWMIIKWKKL